MVMADLDAMTAVLSAPDPVPVDRPARTRADAIRRIDRDLGAYEGVVDLLVKTATDPSILGLAGHLLYVGRVLD